MADTMLSFRDHSLATEFLSESDLMKKCPLAFRSTSTNPNVSTRYSHVSTIDVVRDMAERGWYPVDAKQCRQKKNSSGIRSFHMICFQNPTMKPIMRTATGAVEAYPRIILTNSHDGFSSFKFMVGLFRLVCSNGLVSSDQTFADVTIKHMEYSTKRLDEVIELAVQNVPAQIAAMNAMFNTTLSYEQQKEMAVKAYKIRKGMDIAAQLYISDETIEGILTPVRPEDEGNDLWTVFNRIQESIIRGKYYYSKNENSKPRKARSITSAIKDLEINTSLYALANSYIAA